MFLWNLQDATQQLVVIPREKRDYTRYLDRDFLKAYEIVDCRSGAQVQTRPPKMGFLLSILTLISISFSSALRAP